MKKQLIGAAAALLLLAGCGSANEATKKETKACTFKESGQEIVLTLHAEVKMDASADGAFMKSMGIDADESDMKLDEFVQFMEEEGAVCK